MRLLTYLMALFVLGFVLGTGMMSVGWWFVIACNVVAVIGLGTLTVKWATKGTIPRKQLMERKIELLMQPTPIHKPSEEWIQEQARYARRSTGFGTGDALPGNSNGAITKYLIGEIDAEKMEELLDARIADAVTREQYNIPKGMGHSGPPSRFRRKEQ